MAASRRRPSVSFVDPPLPPPPPPLTLTVSPPPLVAGVVDPAGADNPEASSSVAAGRRLVERLRGLRQQGAPVPFPLVFMALGMASVVRVCVYIMVVAFPSY